jgi:hypothetical protein
LLKIEISLLEFRVNNLFIYVLQQLIVGRNRSLQRWPNRSLRTTENRGKTGAKNQGRPRKSAWKKGVRQRLLEKGPQVKKRRATEVVEIPKFVERVCRRANVPAISLLRI